MEEERACAFTIPFLFEWLILQFSEAVISLNWNQLEMSTFHVLDSPYFLRYFFAWNPSIPAVYRTSSKIGSGFAENLKADLYHKEHVYTLHGPLSCGHQTKHL